MHAGSHADRNRGRHIGRRRVIQAFSYTGRQAKIHIGRQAGRQTDKQAGKQSYRQTFR